MLETHLLMTYTTNLQLHQMTHYSIKEDTGGVPEVTLSTCTDDSKERTIILARAEQEEQQ